MGRSLITLCLSIYTYMCVYAFLHIYMGFPGSSAGKESTCNAGDPGSTPGLGRFPRGGHRNPLQYSCLENSMDRGAWKATVHGVAKSQMAERLSTQHTHTYIYLNFIKYRYYFMLT